MRGITPNPILGHAEAVFLIFLAHALGEVLEEDNGIPESRLGIKVLTLSHSLSEGSPLLSGNIKKRPFVGRGQVLRPEFAIVVEDGRFLRAVGILKADSS